MISAECFSAQYNKIFNTNFKHGPEDKSVFYLVKELQEFFKLAAANRNVELCKPFEGITMSRSENFPVKEDNVLVLLSGGLGSAASLWWTIKQGYTPWVLFVDNFTPEANLREREAVKRLVLGTRNQDGLPLCGPNSDPRWITMPFTYQHGDMPHNLAMLYYMAYDVAKSRQCSRIVWGAVGQEQVLLKSLSTFFDFYGGPRGTLLIQSIFPFASREEILTELRYAEVVSEKILETTLENERPHGAHLPSKAIEHTHSCVGKLQRNWAANVEDGRNCCSGCYGCSRWANVQVPDWRGYVEAQTQTPLLSTSWKPVVEAEPRSKLPLWSATLKRLANEPQIEAKRQKIAQNLREESLRALEQKEQEVADRKGKAGAKKRIKTVKKNKVKPAAAKAKAKKSLKKAMDQPDEESGSEGQVQSLAHYGDMSALDSIFGSDSDEQDTPASSKAPKNLHGDDEGDDEQDEELDEDLPLVDDKNDNEDLVLEDDAVGSSEEEEDSSPKQGFYDSGED